MTERELEALRIKFMAVGYQGLTPTELQAVAYTITAAGCASCRH